MAKKRETVREEAPRRSKKKNKASNGAAPGVEAADSAEAQPEPEAAAEPEPEAEAEAQQDKGVDLVGDGEADADEDSVEDTHAYLKGLLEALLFVSDRPLELKELSRAAKVDKKRTEELLSELSEEYVSRGLRIDMVAGGYTFRSNPMYSGAVRHFLSQRPVRLSRAQIETLAIVAYRQPITRPEVDDIRGVDCGPVLKGLLERELVRIIGKKDEPGRPMLYGTTPAFLELFSMTSLRDLPTLKEFTELSDESKQAFEHETGEEAPEGPIEVEPTEEPEEASAPAPEEESEAATEPSADETVAEAPAAAEEEEDGDEDDDDEDDEDEDEDDDD